MNIFKYLYSYLGKYKFKNELLLSTIKQAHLSTIYGNLISYKLEILRLYMFKMKGARLIS